MLVVAVCLLTVVVDWLIVAVCWFAVCWFFVVGLFVVVFAWCWLLFVCCCKSHLMLNVVRCYC